MPGASRRATDGLPDARVETGAAMVVNALCIVAGSLTILVVLNDVFQSVIVPRSGGRMWRVSSFAWKGLWALWPRLAQWLYGHDERRREDFLASFAPFALIVLLLLWVAGALVGFAAIFWAYRAGFAPATPTFGGALYFSGTSLFTLGFGDIVGRSAATRAGSVLEALTGLAILSIVTAYLFAIFAAFQSREAFVVTVSARAGRPPSGVNVLAVAAYAGTRGSFDGLMLDAQRWTAAVIESHLAYPVLAYFRSTHDYQSWVGTLGTLLDAAVLAMTTVEELPLGEARIFYTLGRHATHDLARHFRIPRSPAAIERGEFERACDRLARAGYTLRDRDEAWHRFCDLRAAYAPELNALAHFFRIPALQWIGDRTETHRLPIHESAVDIPTGAHEREPSDDTRT